MWRMAASWFAGGRVSMHRKSICGVVGCQLQLAQCNAYLCNVVGGNIIVMYAAVVSAGWRGRKALLTINGEMTRLAAKASKPRHIIGVARKRRRLAA